MSTYARYKANIAAVHAAISARNEADAHWHGDMWVYWTQQEVPPQDSRWMPAWLSTHDASQLLPNAKNPKEQREARLAALKDAFYDEARRKAYYSALV